MLYFIEQRTPHVTVEHVWHINEKRPYLLGPCIEVQADMDELDAIKTQFSNLPIPHGKSVVIWKGELAQFIYDNLSEKHTKVHHGGSGV